MKKVLVVYLLFLSSTLAQAQTTAPSPKDDGYRGFKGGIEVNPLISWLKCDVDNAVSQSIKGNGAKLGISYGLTLDRFFAPNYGLNFKIHIAHMGGSFTYVPDKTKPETVTRNLHLQYIEIPITLKMRTNEVGYLKYFGQFGFMPAINVKRKGDISYTDQNGVVQPPIDNQKLGSDVNLFMMYLVIGAGAEYNLGGSTSLVGGITWNNGFTNVWHRTDGVTSGTYKTSPLNNLIDTKPAYIALNIGILF